MKKWIFLALIVIIHSCKDDSTDIINFPELNTISVHEHYSYLDKIYNPSVFVVCDEKEYKKKLEGVYYLIDDTTVHFFIVFEPKKLGSDKDGFVFTFWVKDTTFLTQKNYTPPSNDYFSPVAPLWNTISTPNGLSKYVVENYESHNLEIKKADNKFSFKIWGDKVLMNNMYYKNVLDYYKFYEWYYLYPHIKYLDIAANIEVNSRDLKIAEFDK